MLSDTELTKSELLHPHTFINKPIELSSTCVWTEY
jgi:hypothetical protein